MDHVMVVAVLGVLFITGKYATGMIRSTLTAVPTRLPALWAKALVLTAVTAITAAIAVVLSWAVALPALHAHHAALDLGDPQDLQQQGEAVPSHRHRSAVVEFPNALEILVARDFDAPIQLVFDVLTKPEHMRKTAAPFGEQISVFDIDYSVGGDYHYVFVAEDGTECSFRGTFLEVEPPTRSVATWFFDGWPDAEAVESMDLHETDGVTTLTYRLTFTDQAGRDHYSKTDGLEANFDNIEDLIRSLLER